MATILSTLPTGQRFRTADGVYTRCEPSAWDKLRENPDHWLHGISPQVERREDVIYCVQVEPSPGVLVLMQPTSEVEPVAAWEGQRYRVKVNTDWIFGADTIEAVQKLIRMIALTSTGGTLLVAIQDAGTHINADGTPCKEQGKGLQYRAVEVRVMVGSVAV